jgi:hypothetical protein
MKAKYTSTRPATKMNFKQQDTTWWAIKEEVLSKSENHSGQNLQ